MELTRGQKLFLKVLLGWVLATTGLVTAIQIASKSAVGRAVLGMGWGLILLWIVFCGGLMVRYRAQIRHYVALWRLDWRVKFVLFCTLLALLEEAITTGMTNLAPFFGVRVGQVYITASANWLDVVALHSVSLFVSFFVGWSVILSRLRFSPFAVFLLFGITGTICEMLYGGPQHILEFGMWIFVYGWMVYLPAYCVPIDRPAREPRWWHYPLSVFAPFPFLALFPLAAVIHLFFPHHPNMHFPPLK